MTKNKILLWFTPKYSLSEKILFSLVLLYVSISCWTAYINGIIDKIDIFLYLSTAKVTFVILFFGFILYTSFKILWWKISTTPTPLIKDWWPKLKHGLINKDRFVGAIPMFFILVIFLSMMSNMKGFISYYGNYSWDPLLADIDRKIHFNTDPWRLLHPFFGHPIITSFLNQLYNLWFGFLIFFLYWQLFTDRTSHLRLQFYYTFVIVWAVNGTMLAILFASGGPCFFEALTGNNYFQELMNYLHQVNLDYDISAIQTQNRLFDLYQKEEIIIGVGISAMPSMHVATSFLFYLLTSNINKWIGYFFGAYCLLIFIGSIHLAWHYAIDGYFSVLTTWLYWILAGKLIKKLEQLESKRNFFSICYLYQRILCFKAKNSNITTRR